VGWSRWRWSGGEVGLGCLKAVRPQLRPNKALKLTNKKKHFFLFCCFVTLIFKTLPSCCSFFHLFFFFFLSVGSLFCRTFSLLPSPFSHLLYSIIYICKTLYEGLSLTYTETVQ
jgi:hypothetical protein